MERIDVGMPGNPGLFICFFVLLLFLKYAYPLNFLLLKVSVFLIS